MHRLLIVGTMLAVLAGCDRRVHDVRALDGCYEGDGLPDFMRPSKHWAFKLRNGALLDRSGAVISHISLGQLGPKSTKVVFSPGIRLTEDQSKFLIATRGGIVSGWAMLDPGRATILLNADLRSPMQTTACD
jgi:hypothetical protein